MTVAKAIEKMIANAPEHEPEPGLSVREAKILIRRYCNGLATPQVLRRAFAELAEE
ncbi:MAG: hypothetical protein SAJ12_09280 [Jaaginema sp. PMC 1079.18]|nr:hypothetical protein [Jaaginema sp. PMC 1080.18]MEC4851192.1 hypothetical protein [Jaaginema sp. PMC 1079.18]MEC4864789.1 hypothetical protein [Jaaginema sp. PMC 1078.18]